MIASLLSRRPWHACFNSLSHSSRNTISSSLLWRYSSSLSTPSVVYSNHHVCVINKPAGWHSIPNPAEKDKRILSATAEMKESKCLLSWCKDNELGGGSDSRFLLPLHRLDQPCTGSLVMAKTSKAATRITKEWKAGKVTKSYICVLPRKVRSLSQLHQYSKRIANDKQGYTHELSGLLTKDRKPLKQNGKLQPSAGWSVVMKPLKVQGMKTRPPKGTRLCRIQWKSISRSNDESSFAVIKVQTTIGARHMIRALLGQIASCPIAGDTRYGSSTNNKLPDRSVALHGFEVTFEPSLQLGGLDNSNRRFVSPLPTTWKDYFDLTDCCVDED